MKANARARARPDEAGAEVVGAMLIFGIFIGSIALLNVTAVPRAGLAAEEAHFSEVLNELGSLQSAAEVTAFPGAVGSTASRAFELSPTYRPGQDFFSFFVASPAKAVGEVTFDPDYGNVRVYHYRDGVAGPLVDVGSFTTPLPFGRLGFDQHPEFREPGVLSAEMGGVVTTSGTSETMRFAPPISVGVKDGTTNVTIKVRLLNGTAETVGGSAAVRTTMESRASTLLTPPVASVNRVVLYLETQHGHAWGTFLNRTAEAGGLSPTPATDATGYTTTVSVGTAPGGLDQVTWIVKGTNAGSADDVRFTRGFTAFDLKVG